MGYTASDDTPFDNTRAGYGGCDYTQTGTTTVGWQNVWRVTAAVHQRTGHVQIKKIKKIKGPVDHRQLGDSEISGKLSNDPQDNSRQCSRSGRAGSYDCTAEAVTPHAQKSTTLGFSTSESKPTAWDLDLPSYALLTASYEGSAPGSFSCARNIGSNRYPGGFAGTELIGLISGDAQVTLTHEELIHLRVGKDLVSKIQGNDSPGWQEQDFPNDGDYCGLGGEGNDEQCAFDSPTRNANVIIERVG